MPAPALTEAHREDFFVGNSFFNQNWVAAPSSVANRDGLGPLFNARSCSGCHFKDGRGRPPNAGDSTSSMLLRIGVAGRGEHGAPLAHPVYGDQIQNHGVTGVPAEVDVRVEYDEISGVFASGEPYHLRKPRYRFEQWGYGVPDVAQLLVSARVAPVMIGLGLLEAVAESELTALEDPSDRDNDGISGRRNVVWSDQVHAFVRGRFGWKAEQPDLAAQIAGALQGDMGITSTRKNAENHTVAETACASQPSGGSPEIADETFRSMLLYTRALGVPAQRTPHEPTIEAGRALFRRARCAACHVETLRSGKVTEVDELGDHVVRPYTDLLLHDLGPGLGDDRPTFQADGNEWRTPPLWGIGLVERVNGHTFLLHDGRARDVSEAILWHDGEGRAARDAFIAMSATERSALLAFVQSL